MRATEVRPQLRRMSVALVDQGEMVPGRGAMQMEVAALMSGSSVGVPARAGGVAGDQGLQAVAVAALPVDEVEMAGFQPTDRGLGLPAALQQRLPAEIGQGVRARRAAVCS